GNPEICLQDHAVMDSGCFSHMTGNKAYLLDYEDYNGGFMAFGSDPKGGKITGKGKIRAANLDFDDVAGSGPDWMFDLDFLTNTMNYIPVSVENQVNVDANVADKEEQHTLTETKQALKDDLERMIAQEIAAKAINDATRQAFEEEKKRAAQATSINKLNTGRPSVSTSNSPLVITANTPYASVASTPTSENTGRSSFVYLGGQIPIDISTLPNADLPIDPNMPDLEDDSNVFPNDGIFSGAYDDEDVGADSDFNNMDNTINVSHIPTLRVHKDHPKGQILGDPKLAVQTEEGVDKGRQSGETEEVKLNDDTEVVKDKSSSDKGGNAKELVSTARPEISTARPDIVAARKEDSDV
ncbi:hypothetical protein Tco_1557624, partial [Tanacetum coccineum]